MHIFFSLKHYAALQNKFLGIGSLYENAAKEQY
jgi:hypothetical protein